MKAGRMLLHHQGAWLEWSGVLDQPVTTGMGRDEMLEHLVGGGVGIDEAEAAIERAERHGSSASDARQPEWGRSLEDVIADNRVGPDEARMDPGEFVRRYLVEREDLF